MHYLRQKPFNPVGEKMEHSKLVVLVGLVTVFLIAGMAFAQWPGGQGSPSMGCQDRFDALDINHDGKLTKEEFMADPDHKGNAEEKFKAMDVNGHGYITKEEFCSGQGMGKKGMRHGQQGEARTDETKEKEKEKEKEKQILDKKVDDAINKAWEEK